MLYSRTLLFIQNYFQKPSLFLLLGFQSTSWVYILRYDLEGNSNSRKKFLLFFLVFGKGIGLMKGGILLFLSVRSSSFYFWSLLTTIMSVYFSHLCSWYHSLVPCTSVNSVYLSTSLTILLWPHFMIFCNVYFSISLPSQIHVDTWIYPEIPSTDIQFVL